MQGGKSQKPSQFMRMYQLIKNGEKLYNGKAYPISIAMALADTHQAEIIEVKPKLQHHEKDNI